MEDKVTLLEVVDRAAENAGTRFAGQPEFERSLRRTIARTYHGLASWEKAESQWRAMLDAARKREPRLAKTYLAQGGLAHIFYHRGRMDAEVVVGDRLIVAYMKASENARLADLLLEQLPEARKTLPKDSPQLAGLLVQIGVSLLQQKKWSDAEPLLRECLEIREKMERDVWSTFNTKSLLGGAQPGQKKYADAEPLLLKGYEGMRQREAEIPEPAKVRLAEALDRLIEFSTATNKPDEVKKWQAERAKYQATVPPPGAKRTTSVRSPVLTR